MAPLNIIIRCTPKQSENKKLTHVATADKSSTGIQTNVSTRNSAHSSSKCPLKSCFSGAPLPQGQDWVGHFMLLQE